MHYEHYCHSQHPKCQPGLPATPINDKKQASEPRRKPTEEELDEISILSHEDEDGARSGFRNRLQGFDWLVLWHPDVPVDERKYEYLRSLAE
jgi:hypothetical protein